MDLNDISNKQFEKAIEPEYLPNYPCREKGCTIKKRNGRCSLHWIKFTTAKKCLSRDSTNLHDELAKMKHDLSIKKLVFDSTDGALIVKDDTQKSDEIIVDQIYKTGFFAKAA